MLIFLNTLKQTFVFVLPLLAIIFLNLFLIQLLLDYGILKRLEKIAKPLVKISNLHPACITPVLVAIGSHLSANAMLQQLNKNKIINKKEVLLASILSTVFIPIKELRFHLGVIIPALGIYVGCFYVFTLWLGTFVLICFVIIIGKIYLPERKWNESSIKILQNVEKKDRFTILKNSFRDSFKTFKRIAFIFILTVFIVFLLINLGIFKKIEAFIKPLAEIVGIPERAIPALTVYITSSLAGYSMIGALIKNHLISEKEAIFTLLFGSIFMLPLVYLRFYFPQWISIFGFKLGAIRGLISLFLILLTRICILIIFLIVA